MSKLFSENQSASSRGMAADSAPAIPVPRRLLLWLTIGVVGTVLFPIIYLIEGVTRPGFDAWQQTISALSLGPGGWIQQLNFALCGVSVLWLAYVWRKILAGGVCATWYPIIRSIEGLGLIAIAIFTQDPLHTAFLIVIVNAMCLGLFIISRRFWRNPDFRGWTTFSVACGLWPMIVMPIYGVALNAHSVLTGYAGLFERLATNADTIWGVVLLIPLWAGRRLMQSNA
ncbi:MAG TPA: DUF998 domain-containing protein [Ktedonobacteraceae bacterium]|nr:DUF998 domain-containing protein [Ktedonobacteraceae bacterium]